MQKFPLTTEPEQTIENVPASFQFRSLGKEDGNIYFYAETTANVSSPVKIAVRCFETEVDIEAVGYRYLGSIDKDGKMYHFYGDMRISTIYGE